MMRALTVVAAVAAVMAAAGCSTEETGAAGPAEPPSPVGPVTDEIQVRMSYTGVPGTSRNSSVANYDAAVELGAPEGASGPAGCSLAAPEGTVTVPVTLTLVNTDDPDAPVAAAGAPEGADQDAEPLRAGPFVAAEAVGGAGPLRWQDPQGGDCTDQPDLSGTDSWQFREQVQVVGYLTGVPAGDPAGAGVRVEFTRDLWEVHAGAPDPLTLTY